MNMNDIKIASLVVTITGILSIFIPLVTFIFILSLVVFVYIVNKNSKEFGDWVKTIKVDFPKPLRWIGGFISVIAPGYSVLNKKWVRKRTKAADLHEKMHMELLFKHYWVFYFLAFTVFTGMLISLLISFLNVITNIQIYLQAAAFSMFFVYFEYRTNREVEKQFNVIPDNVKNLRDYYLSYFVIYFTQFTIILFIFNLVGRFL